jgi:hypothetical protein
LKVIVGLTEVRFIQSTGLVWSWKKRINLRGSRINPSARNNVVSKRLLRDRIN